MNFGLDPNRWETTNLGASTRCSVQLYAWQASAPSCTSHSAGCLGFSTLRATLNASVPNSGSYTWAVPRAFHSEYDWADAPVSILTLLNCRLLIGTSREPDYPDVGGAAPYHKYISRRRTTRFTPRLKSL
jgi:hypothetical protein